MKTAMLLLVSAVALLHGAAVSGPAGHRAEEKDNLRRIINLSVQYNKSVTEEFFVEDVLHLLEDGCKDAFFCKVYDILDGHKYFGKRKEENEILRNMKIVTDGANPNCTVLLQNVTSTGVSRPIPKLLEHLITCVRRRNTYQ